MSGIIGRKIGMTSIFDEDGKNIPCTLIEAGPCVVTQLKSRESDGYAAVQLGFGERKEKRTPRALNGHFKKASTSPKKVVNEFRNFSEEYHGELQLGQELTVGEVFDEGDYVDAIGISKGKGFQGVVRRHGFGGVGQRTHGQHNRERAPGSIGGASYPARVFKGIRMGGQMGNKRTKVLNLRVVKIYKDENLVLVSGSVPGPKNSTVILEK